MTALPPAPEPAATQASLVSDSSAKAAVSAAKQLDCDTATADLRRAAASAIQTGSAYHQILRFWLVARICSAT